MKADILGVVVSTSSLVGRTSPWVGSVGTSPSTPTDDPFYQIDYSTVANLNNGDIIRSRPVGVTSFTNVANAYQVMYRTENSWGDTRATITTIIVPENNTNENILSYMIAEDSSYLGCAPSYSLLQASVSDIQTALNEGWVVNVPDYEGLNSSFTAGVMSGKMTLDSIRAVTNSKNLTGINNTQNGLWGYSGGSIATGWASELQVVHAPELEITAVALGGYVVNLTATVEIVNDSIYVGFIPSGFLGLASEYTDLWTLLYEQLIPSKISTFESVLTQCLEADILDFLGQDIFSYFQDGSAILQNPDLSQVLNNQTLGHTAPQHPFYIYQGVNDQIAPIGPVDAVAEFYCSNNTPLLYNRIAGQDHVGAMDAGDAGAFDFLRSAFNGNVPTSCTFEGASISSTATSSPASSTAVSTAASSASNSSAVSTSGSSVASSSAASSSAASTSGSSAASSSVASTSGSSAASSSVASTPGSSAASSSVASTPGSSAASSSVVSTSSASSTSVVSTPSSPASSTPVVSTSNSSSTATTPQSSSSASESNESTSTPASSGASVSVLPSSSSPAVSSEGTTVAPSSSAVESSGTSGSNSVIGSSSVPFSNTSSAVPTSGNSATQSPTTTSSVSLNSDFASDISAVSSLASVLASLVENWSAGGNQARGLLARATGLQGALAIQESYEPLSSAVVALADVSIVQADVHAQIGPLNNMFGAIVNLLDNLSDKASDFESVGASQIVQGDINGLADPSGQAVSKLLAVDSDCDDISSLADGVNSLSSAFSTAASLYSASAPQFPEFTCGASGSATGSGVSTATSSGSSAATGSASASGAGSASESGSGSATASGESNGATTITTVVSEYTTYCPDSTTFTEGSHTYTVTEATTLTITNCPCTRTIVSTTGTAKPAETSVISEGATTKPAETNGGVETGVETGTPAPVETSAGSNPGTSPSSSHGSNPAPSQATSVGSESSVPSANKGTQLNGKVTAMFVVFVAAIFA